MILMTLCLLATASLLALLLIRRRQKEALSYLKNLGFPTKKAKMGLLHSPNPLWLHRHKSHEILSQHFEEMDCKTFTALEGVTPCIFTIDTRLIQSVLVTNFDCFNNMFSFRARDENMHLAFAEDDVWRSLRKRIAPQFSLKKIAKQITNMARVADNVVSFIDESYEKSQIIDAKPIFEGWGIDIISSCAFGIETDALRDPGHRFNVVGQRVTTNFRAKNWLSSLFFHLHFHLPILGQLLLQLPNAMDDIYRLTRQVLHQRRNDGKLKRDDFIGRLDEILASWEREPKTEMNKGLNEDIIYAQGIFLFLAGHKAVSASMASILHDLARNPQCQDRMYRELLSVLERHSNQLDMSALGELEYMEACIRENLRMRNTVALYARTCNKDCELWPGLRIRRGTVVYMPIYACHMSEDYFEQPRQFRPERFLKENEDQLVPYSFQAFGGGPRSCFGMNFGLVEMKIMLAKLLMRYSLVDDPDLEVEYHDGELFLMLFDRLDVRLKRRPNNDNVHIVV